MPTLTPTDLLTTDPTMSTLDTDTIEHYPMPPSPTAEPFIPASSVPATAPTPRDRAYALSLQGYRSPAIAAHLHVPQRTIRHWIHTTNQELNDLPALADLADLANLADLTDLSDPVTPDQQATHSTATTDPAACPLPAPGRGQGERSSLTTLQHQRTLAIERHRARAAAAWALHEQLRATLDPFLARLSERLLLHTQYPDDQDHVSMSTLELAGGPLSPAFRAMYHMLPGLINGLTRTLTLAERADLQVDRLLGLPGIIPSSAPAQPTQLPAPKPTTTPPAEEETTTPWATREEINRAVEAERIAEEDAGVIPHLTTRQRALIRLYASLPDPLPEGPVETWNIKIDPNASLTRWREVFSSHKRHLGDPDYDPDDDDPDDPDDDPDPAPPSGKGGNHFGKKTANHPASVAHHRARTTAATGGGKDPHAPNRTDGGKDARADASNSTGDPSGNPGNKIGNDFGNKSGNSGNKIGNRSGNNAHADPPNASLLHQHTQ